MSETLRDLVVSLSLQTDNFTRNIRSVNKQIAEAESKFKLAAAGVEGFEKTAAGLSTQLSTLERQAVPAEGRRHAVRARPDRRQRQAAGVLHSPDGLRPAPDGCPDGAAGAQGTGGCGGAAGARVFLHAGRERFRDHRRQGQSGRAQDRVPRLRAGGQETRRAEHGVAARSTQNAADAVSTASTNLNKARAAVKTTQAEIDKCNQALRLAQTNWEAAGEAIEDSRAAINDLRQADFSGREPLQAGHGGDQGAGYQRHRALCQADAA